MAAATDEILDVYNAFCEGIFSYCLYRLFRKDEAEDAMAEVFLRLVRRYPTLIFESQDHVRRWLYCTAGNVVAEFLRDGARRKRIHDALSLEHDSVCKNVASEDVVDWPTLYEAVKRLRERDQAIVVMRYFQKLGFVEIARNLDMTEVAVRARLSRAIRTLRRDLGVRV